MKITYEWLKEYVNIGLVPRELAGKLTMLGFECSVEGKINGEQVLDVEITANRPDCLCVLGLAREISAATGAGLVTPEVKLIEDGSEIDEMVAVEIKTELCSRYCARVISDVKVDSSPEWLRRRLEAVGLRPINNVVDITNYVLIELGHPLHAFDYDCLQGKKIIVRCSRKGEKLVTLDEVERKLEPSMMVIADEKVPVALAGIMGGLESEVTDRTKTILLESAYFAPFSVRKTSKYLQVETEASYRFQRKADIEGMVSAIDRTAQLIQEIAGGRIARGIVDCYPHRVKKREVELRLSRLEKLLGVELSPDYVENQLQALGFEARREAKKFTVSIPGFRRDIEREVDLIEEIARHYGYDRIPSTIPAGRLTPGSEDRHAEVLESTRGILTACGLTEVINHSLINEKWTELLDLNKPLVNVLNPLSEEQRVLRPSLLPGLLQTLSINVSHGVKSVWIFEAGNVFHRNLPIVERESLGVAIMGSRARNWSRAEETTDFYDLKGVLENFLAGLKIVNWKLIPYTGKFFSHVESAVVKFGDSELGVIGKVCDEVKETFDIDENVYAFELDFEFLAGHASGEVKFKPLPKYPASFRDIAIVVPEEVKSADIVSVLMGDGEDVVAGVELFDVYCGRQIPHGRKSLAYSITYRASDRTLTDAEVDELHEKISSGLVSQFGARIRE